MRANKNPIFLQKEYKSYYLNKINPGIKLNSLDLHEKKGPETQNILNYEEEQINYPKRFQIKSNKGKQIYYEEDNSYERPTYTQYKIYQRNTEKGHDIPSDEKLSKNNQYFSEFNKIKKSIDLDSKYNQKSGFTLKDSPKININEKYYKEKEIDRNIDNKRNDIEKTFQGSKNIYFNSNNVKDLKYLNNFHISKNIEYNNINKYNENHEEQEDQKFFPKYYKNNHSVKRGNEQRFYANNRIRKPIMLVAQKICNIVIKGKKKKKNKKKKNKNIKKEKITTSKYSKNIQYNTKIKNNKELKKEINNEFDNEEIDDREEIFKNNHYRRENNERFEDYNKIQNENVQDQNEEEYNYEDDIQNIEQDYEQEEDQDENEGEVEYYEEEEYLNKNNKGFIKQNKKREYEKNKYLNQKPNMINKKEEINKSQQVKEKNRSSNKQPIKQIQKIDIKDINSNIFKINNKKKNS